VLNFHAKPQPERLPCGTGLGEAGRPPSGLSWPLVLPRLRSALVPSPGKWVAEVYLILGCLVGLYMDVEAFRCIQLNQSPTLDSEPHECVSWLLDRSRHIALEDARPAGLEEAGRPGFLPNFGTPAPAIKTHPKLVELVRNKQNMNGT